MGDFPVQLELLNSVPRGNRFIRDVTAAIGHTWRRSIRSYGGFWVGTCKLAGSTTELLDIFLNGLMYEIREVDAGLITWEGIISEMSVTIGKQRWVRSIFEVFNAMRSIYSSIGNSMLTNGGGESGVWTGYNAPTTLEQSTAWRTQGTYSIHIVAGADDRGAYVQQNVAITAKTPYDARLSCNVVSGTWQLAIVRADTGALLADAQTDEVGEIVLRCRVSDGNDFAGNVHMRIATVGATGEIYCDAGVFQRGAIRAETAWAEDIPSQEEFGRIEEVLLRAGMTTSAANAEVQTLLQTRAWPRSMPADEFQANFERALLQAEGPARLDITVAGYFATLNFIHTLLAGTDGASDHVNALVAESAFVTARLVETNTMPFQIDDRAPERLGDTLLDIARAGDASGNRWNIGVYEGRALDYGMANTGLSYHYRNGTLLSEAQTPVQPWLARPGWVRLDDAPVAPGFDSSNIFDDPRWLFAEEVEFQMPDQLRFRRQS